MIHKIINFLKRIFKLKRKPKKRYGKLKFVYKKGYGLTGRIEARAVRKYNKCLNQFVREHKRKPNRSETGRIIINASHMSIQKRGHTGHWWRQKIRHYLFNLHEIKYVKR
jgi:predicted transglutaminase-like protease